MNTHFATPLGRVVPRRAAAAVSEALVDTRVVLVTGARQSGKSTLVGLVARESAAEWLTLDSAVHRHAALTDPTGFVESDGDAGRVRRRLLP